MRKDTAWKKNERDRQNKSVSNEKIKIKRREKSDKKFKDERIYSESLQKPKRWSVI